ncbi:hypothetical protein [Psychromonas antarctica]|uniref:hypothetical protein n=1 Tax=Psychromonas antarctica TaxID=67573 RepID=UPI001EE90AFC|nr:hypothetical protein [Psychromonas antarctica]MCG6200996.1 hypothetical protein [Psychromonas antarctica]
MMGHLYSIFGGSSLRSVQNSGVSGVMNLIPNQTVKTVTQKVGDVVVSEATQTAYSITNANWEYFYKSFDSLDKIKRGRIEKVAGFQVLAHLTSPKESLFWRAVEKGVQ